jgi:hypothetical protein
MAALFKTDVRRVSPLPVRPCVRLARARPALGLAARDRARPKLFMRWTIALDDRPTGGWLSEASAALKNPDD